MRTVAVVLAGGSGTRFGTAGPKQLRLLAGRSLIEHCQRDQRPGLVLGYAASTTTQIADGIALLGQVLTSLP